VYRAPEEACRNCPQREQGAPPGARAAWRRSITRIEEPSATTAFKTKMKTEEAREIYAQRLRVAEFAHAWIKERCGLRQLRCRGRLKATMEATWACLSYNLMRWFGAAAFAASSDPDEPVSELRENGKEPSGKDPRNLEI
jgi:hypothetical protein